MGKKRRSVSLDEDVAELVEAHDSLNFSGLVNQFARRYFEAGSDTDEALRLRLEHIERQIEETEEELDALRAERDRIEEQLADRREEVDEAVEEFLQTVDPGPRFDLSPENPAVRNYASKAGVTPERFVETVEEAKQNQPSQQPTLADGGSRR